MSATTTTAARHATCCRRCGNAILEGRTTAVVTSDAAPNPETVPLCADCGHLLRTWFMWRPRPEAPLRGRVRVPRATGRGTFEALFND